MKDRELLQLGIPHGAALETARRGIQQAAQSGMAKKAIRKALRRVARLARAAPGQARNAAACADDPFFGELARMLAPTQALVPPPASPQAGARWRQWGRDLDPASVDQIRNACSLPISVRGALMPDAHVGYGLPIGGVLATRNAVIPYAVGVDIACRMKMTVLDLPCEALDSQRDRLCAAIETETRFGVGVEFKSRRQHDVMDRHWGVSPVTRQHKDKAWAQLGTSGSGNHFVDFGRLEIFQEGLALPPGKYLALLTHSGSRGTGALVCQHYSRVAMAQRPGLSAPLRHLAWLDLGTNAAEEYWAAMELMGHYAAANHACIHRHIAAYLRAAVLLDIENHHNFAWKEEHYGEAVIVHRKGATPAAQGLLGIIPGSMASPAYVVRGKGEPESLHSAAHGAGRVMSRAQAKKTFRWKEARALLEAEGVTLLSAGLDEVPMVYKNINTVMAAQADLVEPLARFHPAIVKMAPPGERAED